MVGCWLLVVGCRKLDSFAAKVAKRKRMVFGKGGAEGSCSTLYASVAALGARTWLRRECERGDSELEFRIPISSLPLFAPLTLRTSSE